MRGHMFKPLVAMQTWYSIRRCMGYGRIQPILMGFIFQKEKIELQNWRKLWERERKSWLVFFLFLLLYLQIRFWRQWGPMNSRDGESHFITIMGRVFKTMLTFGLLDDSDIYIMYVSLSQKKGQWCIVSPHPTPSMTMSIPMFEFGRHGRGQS